MPTSTAWNLISVISLVKQIKPRSISDVGLGFGKWGFLAREYLEVWGRWGDTRLFDGEERYNWSVRIEGAEVCRRYIKGLQRQIYDRIFIEDIRTLIDKIDAYDLFILGDVIEHFQKDEGRDLLRKCYARANKAVLVITPAVFLPQHDVFGNEAERHRSLWTAGDFRALGDAQCTYVRAGLIAMLSKMGSKFKFENPYKLRGIIYRLVGSLQARSIRKHGLQAFDRPILFRAYYALKERLDSYASA